MNIKKYKVAVVRRAIEILDTQPVRCLTCLILCDAAYEPGVWPLDLTLEEAARYGDIAVRIPLDYRDFVFSLDTGAYPYWWNGDSTPEFRVERRSALVAFLQHLESQQ